MFKIDLSSVFEEAIKSLPFVENSLRQYKMQYSRSILEELVSFAKGVDISSKLRNRLYNDVAVGLLRLSHEFKISALWENIMQLLVVKSLEYFDINSALDMFVYTTTRMDLPVDYSNDLQILTTKGVQVVAMYESLIYYIAYIAVYIMIIIII